MGQLNRIAPVVALFFIFIAIQPVLIALDCWQTPAKVAKQFIKDYYYLDAGMQQWLCAKEGNTTQRVNDYLQGKTDEAAQRGFNVDYLRRMFTHLHLETEHRDAETAAVHIEGTTRTAINPVFMVIGKMKMFNIGQNYPVNVTVDLVKENGQWRVCTKPFGI